MKLFSDESLKNEVPELSDLNFGRVEVGETKTLTYWLYNDSKAYVESIKVALSKVASYEEVKIVSYPKELKAKGKASIVLSWTPTLDIEAGLKGIKFQISGEKVWE